MNNSVLEHRVRKLERLIKESLSLKDLAASEIEDIITDIIKWRSRKDVMHLKREVMDNNKSVMFNRVIDDITANQSDAYDYYVMQLCGGNEDDLYDCEELDEDILDKIDELIF